jgi:hypothetical protein
MTQQLANSSKDFIQLLQKSQQYQRACREYQHYQDWKKNRNPERAEMEAKVGCDCKFAMQAIRLLKTGIEILETQCDRIFQKQKKRSRSFGKDTRSPSKNSLTIANGD